jgi:hypothetical protein
MKRIIGEIAYVFLGVCLGLLGCAIYVLFFFFDAVDLAMWKIARSRFDE